VLDSVDQAMDQAAQQWESNRNGPCRADLLATIAADAQGIPVYGRFFGFRVGPYQGFGGYRALQNTVTAMFAQIAIDNGAR